MSDINLQVIETTGARKTPLLTPAASLRTVFAVVANRYRAADAVEDLVAVLKDKPENKGVLLMSSYTEKGFSDKGAAVSIKNGGAPIFNMLEMEKKGISIIELGCHEADLKPVAQALVAKHSICCG